MKNSYTVEGLKTDADTSEDAAILMREHLLSGDFPLITVFAVKNLQTGQVENIELRMD